MSTLSAEAQDCFERLTKPYMDQGVTVPSLLDQLRSEIFAGMGARGGSGSLTKAPLSVNVLDLDTLIENEASALWVGAARYPTREGGDQGIWAQFGRWDNKLNMNLPSKLTQDALDAFSRKSWRVAYASPTEDITAWVAGLVTDLQAEVAGRILRRWYDMIMGMLYPESRREFTSPCPNCGERYWIDQSGIRRAAIYITFPGGIAHAECSACPASRRSVWVGGFAVLQLAAEAGLKARIAAA